MGQMFEAKLQSLLEEEKADETEPLRGPRNRLADLEEKTAQAGTREPVQDEEAWRVAARMQGRRNLFPRPSTETISGLVPRSKRERPLIDKLMEKTRDGCVSEVEEFLQQHPQVVTKRDEYGYTVLHTVANQRFCHKHAYKNTPGPPLVDPGQKLHKVLQIGEKLIKHAHDLSYDLLNARDDVNGDTPLHAAVVMENPYCIKMLLEHKADKTIRNKDGKTAEDLIWRTTKYKDAIRQAYYSSYE